MTEKRKRPPAKSVHRTMIENVRLKAELRLLRASHDPEGEMLLLHCLQCGAALHLKPTGLRHCHNCDEIERLKREIVAKRPKNNNPAIFRHDCTRFIAHAHKHCPICTKALEGLRGEDLKAAATELSLLRRDYRKEIKQLRDELIQVNITAARALRNARDERFRLEQTIKYFKGILYGITKLEPATDIGIAQFRAQKSLQATWHDIHPPLSPLPKPEML